MGGDWGLFLTVKSCWSWSLMCEEQPVRLERVCLIRALGPQTLGSDPARAPFFPAAVCALMPHPACLPASSVPDRPLAAELEKRPT